VISYSLGGGEYWNDCANPTLSAGTHWSPPIDAVRVVFRNTSVAGGPVGWVLDPALAAGLPPLYEIGWNAQTAEWDTEISAWLWNEGDAPQGGVNCYLGWHGCLTYTDTGAQFAELNGDGHLDVMVGGGNSAHQVGGGTAGAWLNGTWGANGWLPGFVASTAYAPPTGFSGTKGEVVTNGPVRVVDLNGDGLDDIVSKNILFPANVWINNGAGWCGSAQGCTSEQARYAPPTWLDSPVSLQDVNLDGFPDVVNPGAQSRGTWLFDPGTGANQSVWAAASPAYVPPVTAGNDVLFIDADGDGGPDWIKAPPDIEDVEARLSQTPFLDRVATLSNGTGGVASFTYASVIKQRDAALEALAAADATA
jgi:hypothetical protein